MINWGHVLEHPGLYSIALLVVSICAFALGLLAGLVF